MDVISVANHGHHTLHLNPILSIHPVTPKDRGIAPLHPVSDVSTRNIFFELMQFWLSTFTNFHNACFHLDAV